MCPVVVVAVAVSLSTGQLFGVKDERVTKLQPIAAQWCRCCCPLVGGGWQKLVVAFLLAFNFQRLT